MPAPGLTWTLLTPASRTLSGAPLGKRLLPACGFMNSSRFPSQWGHYGTHDSELAAEAEKTVGQATPAPAPQAQPFVARAWVFLGLCVQDRHQERLHITLVSSALPSPAWSWSFRGKAPPGHSLQRQGGARDAHRAARKGHPQGDQVA